MRELSDEQIRERIVQLGFGGDRDRFEMFTAALREALPDDVTVVLRGSVVIGVRWEDGAPFDADGPGTSDLDLTLVGGDMLKLWSDDAFYIPKLHTAPLNDDTPQSCPSLVPLRRALCRIAERAGEHPGDVELRAVRARRAVRSAVLHADRRRREQEGTRRLEKRARDAPAPQLQHPLRWRRARSRDRGRDARVCARRRRAAGGYGPDCRCPRRRARPDLAHWGSRVGHSTGFLSRLPVAHHAWHSPAGAKHPFLEVVLEGRRRASSGST